MEVQLVLAQLTGLQITHLLPGLALRTLSLASCLRVSTLVCVLVCGLFTCREADGNLGCLGPLSVCTLLCVSTCRHCMVYTL